MTDERSGTPTATSTSQIRVYNTMTRSKQPLEPVTPGKVGIYLCGPTVYKPSHIGHMVGPVIFDVIKRYLTYRGFDVTWVVNITDVDDKLIVESNQRGISIQALANEMIADYMTNLAAMGVDTIDHFPKATDNIDAIIDFISRLIDKGFAYAADGDVYFDVGKDSAYGKLSGRSLDSVQGEGGETADRKRSLADFALWKSAKPGEPSWESPWGPGRPGWHIECSVMSQQILGETFDIHGGGLDLVFPHHENEVAQSECCHGKPQAKYWLHNGLMQAGGETGKVGGRSTRAADVATAAPAEGDAEAQEAGKLGKSKGAAPFSELLKKHAPETIRFLLLSNHYRRPIYFSEQRLEEIAASLETFYRYFKRYERVTGESFYALDAAAGSATTDNSDDTQAEVSRLRQRFLDAMDDDFNTGAAIGDLFELVRALNKYVDQHALEAADAPPAEKLATLQQGTSVLRELASILGIFRQPVQSAGGGDDALTGELVALLVKLRAEARADKNYQLGDRIRDGLQELGVTLEDRADGTEWTIQR
ncbi:MAG: cysteine--tRNA ligase [Pirellulales bacterium]